MGANKEWEPMCWDCVFYNIKSKRRCCTAAQLKRWDWVADSFETGFCSDAYPASDPRNSLLMRVVVDGRWGWRSAFDVPGYPKFLPLEDGVVGVDSVNETEQARISAVRGFKELKTDFSRPGPVRSRYRVDGKN
jgi:hypothetical protein